MKRDHPPPLRVLVLGGTGHIGARWLQRHASAGLRVPAEPQPLQAFSASRHAGAGHAPGGAVRSVSLDIRDRDALAQALEDMDVVVNAVAGSASAIADGTGRLCEAAQRSGVRLVHMSTQSVYGHFEGTVHESMPLDPRLGWYGRAKCEAEMHVREFVRQGGQAVVLRPGCVWGPGSQLWVGRTAAWLRAGRLGELGAGGDGWSNLVHVDDVCLAITRALRLPLRPGELPAFNLAAPDSPRWNRFFMDLALALGATPVRRVTARQLWLDSHVLAPPLKAAQLLARRLGLQGLARGLPEPLPPGLLRLWSQHIRLDSSAATRALDLAWTPYERALSDSVQWLQQGCTRAEAAAA